MKARCWFCAVLSLLPFGATLGETSPVLLVVDPPDQTLVISGWLGEPPSPDTFVGSLRLTAQRKAPAQPEASRQQNDAHPPSQGTTAATLPLLLLPSDLKRDPKGTGSTPDLVIDRSNVTLSRNLAALTPGMPTDVAVKVAGIPGPGTYKGKLQLAVATDPPSMAEVDLAVRAFVHPSLTALDSAKELKLDLVRCDRCWLAQRLLPKSAFATNREFGFRNEAASTANWGYQHIEVRGEKTGNQLTTAQIGFPNAETEGIPAGGIGKLGVTLKGAEMAPDHYTGSLYLSVTDAKAPYQVPVNLNVRSGPFWPLVAIAIGVMLGQLVEYMTKKGEPQAEKLEEVERVSRALSRAHPDDRGILEPQLAKVRAQVLYHRLDKVAADLADIEARLEQLEKLRKLEGRLPQDPSTEDAKTALREISEARHKIDVAEDAKASVKSAEEAVDKAIAVQESVSYGPAIGGIRTERQPNSWSRFWKRVATKIPDRERRLEFRAYVTLYVARPLLHALLLLGLVAVGLNTLYLNQPSFGAQPFGDYLGLILWGLSADVARRTLTNLPTARP